MTDFSPIALDPQTRAAIAAGAPVAFSLSGGKDSISISHAANQQLDQLGHPRDRRVSIHADLGRIEWRSTAATVAACAAALGTELIVVRHKTHDMISRWEQRFINGKTRYAALETYNLIGPWSSASKRFCTAEMKTQVIVPELVRRFAGQQILSVVGIRREESVKRRSTAISKAESRAKPRRNGTSVLTWHPGVDWLEDEVFARIAHFGLPLAESYACGAKRHGCSFCVLSTLNDQRAAAGAAGNVPTYLHLVDMEATSTFSFQPQRWLADVAPDLLPAGLATDIARAKLLADQRRAIEAAMPAGLRYVKGWPQRMPTMDEAVAIADARRRILAVHRLDTPYPTAAHVRDRFADLIEQRALKEAA